MIDIVEYTEQYRNWVVAVLVKSWGSTSITHGKTLIDAAELKGFIALRQDEPVGLLTYLIDSPDCEIVTLNAEHQGWGIGTKLVEAVKSLAIDSGCSRLWLVTTNDNIEAIGFYQKRGFSMTKLYRGAMAEARILKPNIPLTGARGISIKDIIECELFLLSAEVQRRPQLTSNTIIERLGNNHIEAIAKLVDGLPQWFDENARISIPLDLRHQDGFVVLIEELAGFASYFVHEGALVIAWIAVIPRLHRKGIGKRLLDALEIEAFHLNLAEIRTYTLGSADDYEPYERTRNWYTAMGFEIYQSSSTDNPHCPQEIKLRKRIGLI